MYGTYTLVVQRPHRRDFFSSWYSKAAMEELLRTETLHYGTNVDVTHFDGQVGIGGLPAPASCGPLQTEHPPDQCSSSASAMQAASKGRWTSIARL